MFKMLSKEKLVPARLEYISVELIDPNPAQPRKRFNEEDLYMLSDSIKNFGILQPLTVRKMNNRFELIAGERRLRASKLAGLEIVPCVITDTKNENSAVLAMIENLQRQDLDYFEEAEGIEALIKNFDLTQEEVAEKLGKSQSAIANKLRLLKLSELIRILLRQGNLTERHARALLKLTDQKLLIEAIDIITKRKLNVSQTERLVEKILFEKTVKKQKFILGFRDVRIFVNTINKAIETMNSSGIHAITRKNESSDNITYTIIIPKAQ